MAHAYTRANGDAERIGREEGLAIFSRYPLSEQKTILLDGGLWRRPALGAVVRSPLGDIATYTAHLSLRPWRNRRQPAKLHAWVEATAGELPAVIGGDFNTSETARHIAALGTGASGLPPWIDLFRAVHPSADGTTHKIKLFGRTVRRRRLDYLFLRPGNKNLRIANCTTITSEKIAFSDHWAVVATLSTPETKTE
jgi:endonuclease/exonuclease/phosphatase family metal-dependent hydrolase